MNPTLGETIVRADFNASRSDAVSNLKNSFARLIDLVDSINLTSEEGQEPEPDKVGEVARLRDIAINHMETAAMYAVKAATTK